MMKKKLLCMLLSIAMVFTVMATTVSASEVQSTDEAVENTAAEAVENQENASAQTETETENTPAETETTEDSKKEDASEGQENTTIKTEATQENTPLQTEAAEENEPIKTEITEENKSDETLSEAISETETTEDRTPVNSSEPSKTEKESDGNLAAETQIETETVFDNRMQSTEIEEETALETKEAATDTYNLQKAADEEEPIDLSAEETAAQIKDIKPIVYNGKPYEPKVTVTVLDGTKRITLKKDKDYTLKYQNNVNAGTDKASVTVTGTGKYKGSITKTFAITPKSMKKLKVITESKYIKDPSTNIYVYDGTVLLNYRTYTVKYNVDSKNPAKVTAEITANENTNYTGTVTAKITVYDVPTEKLIHKGSVSLTGNTVYTGKPITRTIMLKNKNGDELVQNKDYSVRYQNNINAGTATVMITGKGEYKGTMVRTFGITKADVHNKDHMTIAAIPAKIFNGKVQKPSITVKTTSNKKLTLNKDYTVTYVNNLHSGTATIQIKGIGNNCSGSTSITFEIQPQEIKKASVQVTKATDKVPSRIVLKYSGKELQEYADYMITSYEEQSNKKVKVTIKGLADFKGEAVKILKTEIPSVELDAPLTSNNLNKHNYLNFTAYGLEVTSHLFQNDDGTLTRVEAVRDKGVYVERYTADYAFITREQFIKNELPLYGGFHATKDNYFLVFGQKNPKNDDNTEVIRFVKYDKDWNRLGDARLYGINTAEPFIFSSVRMVEQEGVLYVRTGHNMYNGHQANMAFSINIADMKFINCFYTLGGPSIASHSLNQYVTLDEPYLITADHGDAYPRGILLAKHVKAGEKNTYFTSQKSAQTITALQLGGAPPSNITGASVGGLEASDTSYLVVGNSVDQTTQPYNPKGILNIYVSSTPKDNFTNEAVKERWITDYKYLEYTDANGNPQKTPEASVYTPQLVKLNGNEMMLLWTQVTTVIENNAPKRTTDVKCVLLNGDGEPVSGIYSFEGGLSDCKPILIDGKLVWYYTNKSAPKFCTLDPEDVRRQPR